jgi:hypothetical protein
MLSPVLADHPRRQSAMPRGARKRINLRKTLWLIVMELVSREQISASSGTEEQG